MDAEGANAEGAPSPDFTSDAYADKLRALSTPHQRQELAAWSLHHNKHSAAMIQLWKREVLGASPERWPSLLYLAGDIIQISTDLQPALAIGFCQILPRLISTLLYRAPADSVQVLHQALHSLLGELDGNPAISKHWIAGLKRGVEMKVEADGLGWIVNVLANVDRMWSAAVSEKQEIESCRTSLHRMYEDLRQRAISGSAEQLGTMGQLAEKCLSMSHALCQTLENLRHELREAVAEPAEEALREDIEEYEALQRELHEMLQGKAKAEEAKAKPPVVDPMASMFDDMEELFSGVQPPSKKAKVDEPKAEEAAKQQAAPQEPKAEPAQPLPPQPADDDGMFSSDSDGDDVMFRIT